MEILFALEKSHSATCLIAHSFKEGCVCHYYLHAVTCPPPLLIEYGNGINYASIKSQVREKNRSSTKSVCVSGFISKCACVRLTMKENNYLKTFWVYF